MVHLLTYGCWSVRGRLVVSGLSTRSNACYYGADLAALPGRRDGRGPRRRTEQHWMHGFHHLAKVRVAGSNPVVRSRKILTLQIPRPGRQFARIGTTSRPSIP